MDCIVRILDCSIKNLKNVREGYFKTKSSQEAYKVADVIGFYGQNGSGKTAVIEGLGIFKSILDGETLPATEECLIHQSQKNMELTINLFVKNLHNEYYVKYHALFSAGEKYLVVEQESLWYKENAKGKQFKSLVTRTKDDLSIRSTNLKKMKEDLRVAVMVVNKLAFEKSTSVIFNNEMKPLYDHFLSSEELLIMNNVTRDFNDNFHVISNVQSGLMSANILLPVNIHLQDSRGNIPYNLSHPMVVSREIFAVLEQVIAMNNVVLKTVIPGLEVIVNRIHDEKMIDGKDGIRFEFLSRKNGIELPLRCESAGTLKIISVLNTLIAVYNNPNACVAIDELDAGVFEYLLGELLEVIDENGKGQLIFTSHNLRILEVLPIQNLWFTTLNEHHRFIQLKGVRELSNARDIYLRAVQLGGQDENMYKSTDSFDIKKSFRKAGKLNGESQ